MAEQVEKELQKIVGVRFRATGKIYHFDPGELELKPGDDVIVDTEHGPGFANIATPVREIESALAPSDLKKVLRLATDEDRRRREENRATEKRGKAVWEEKIAELGLEMALVDVEYAFDRSKLLFYFTADGRIDFREFVKELAGIFKTRIELRQIGVRDEAKKIGGLGPCGRPFCCASFLPDFEQVSIKMAKEQNLSLNSAKISGTCGRLMCCLRYENDTYAAENKLTPKVENVVDTPDGRGVVTESNILAGTVKVKLDDDPEKAPQTYRREDLTVVMKKRPKQQNPGRSGAPAAEKEKAELPEEAAQAPQADAQTDAQEPIAAAAAAAGEEKSAKKERFRRPRGRRKKPGAAQNAKEGTPIAPNEPS